MRVLQSFKYQFAKIAWHPYLQVENHTRMYECVFIKIGNSDFLVGKIDWYEQV